MKTKKTKEKIVQVATASEGYISRILTLTSYGRVLQRTKYLGSQAWEDITPDLTKL